MLIAVTSGGEGIGNNEHGHKKTTELWLQITWQIIQEYAYSFFFFPLPKLHNTRLNT